MKRRGIEEEITPHKARIWKKHEIERDGHVLGDGNAATALPGDFTIPVDDVRDADKLDVTLSSFELSTAVESVPDTPTTEVVESRAIRRCHGSLIFDISSIGGGERNMTFDLTYNVQFVTAHPCIPSPHHKSILNTPTAPSIQIPNPAPDADGTKLGPHDLYAGM
jgi:hypothetical protein